MLRNTVVQTTCAAILPLACTYAFTQANNRDAQTPPSASIDVRERTPRFDRAIARIQRQDEADRFQSYVRGTFNKVGTQDFDQLVDVVANMPFSEIGLLTTEVNTLFREDRETAKKWLTALCDGLVESTNHDRALDIAGYFFSNKDLPDIERRVLYRITEESWDLVTDRFTKLYKDEAFIDRRQAAIAISLAMNERSESKDQLLDWIKSAGNDPKLAQLQGVFLEKMAKHVDRDSENFDQTIALFEKNLNNRFVSTHLPEVALRYAPKDPAKTFEWLAKLDTNDSEIRENAYSRVMQEMVLDRVPEAAEIMSASNFLDLYYRSEEKPTPYTEDGEIRPEAKEFYDRILTGFMDGIVSADPQLVAESVDSFFSEEKKAEYLKIAQELLESSEDLAAAKLPACGTPGCTNEDHHH